MNKNKIKQANHTLNNDLSNTKRTKRVIEKMVVALNDHRIDDIGEFFSDDFNWFFYINRSMILSLIHI